MNKTIQKVHETLSDYLLSSSPLLRETERILKEILNLLESEEKIDKRNKTIIYCSNKSFPDKPHSVPVMAYLIKEGSPKSKEVATFWASSKEAPTSEELFLESIYMSLVAVSSKGLNLEVLEFRLNDSVLVKELNSNKASIDNNLQKKRKLIYEIVNDSEVPIEFAYYPMSLSADYSSLYNQIEI